MDNESQIKNRENLLEENRKLIEENRRLQRMVELQEYPFSLIKEADNCISLTDLFGFILDSLLNLNIFTSGAVLLANGITGNFILSVQRGLTPFAQANLSVVEKESSLIRNVSGGSIYFGTLVELLPENNGSEEKSLYAAITPVSIRGGVDAAILLFSENRPDWGSVEKNLLYGISIIARNAMYRGRSVEEVRQSLHEKEVLLREVHHRVKNSLSMILGFIRLGQDDPEYSECSPLMEHLGNKVESIALVYQHLHQGQSFSTVELSYYLNKLIPQIIDSMTIRERFTVEYDFAEAEVDADSGIWFGLIVTELITNTIRHGYENDQDGRISISLSRVRSGYMLDYQDYGKGLPEDYMNRAEGSLGLQLIESLTERMGGSLTIDARNGRFLFSFPLKN